jgi:hypothetical protein
MAYVTTDDPSRALDRPQGNRWGNARWARPLRRSLAHAVSGSGAIRGAPGPELEAHGASLEVLRLDLDRLRELAGAFRDAIERADRNRLPIEFRDFPSGSCGEATLLLGIFLTDQGMGTFRYVCGWRDDHSHVWLEADGLIVDITADQFPEISERVIVTRCSRWHSAFERDGDPHEADYRIFDERARRQSERTYKVIVAGIEL